MIKKIIILVLILSVLLVGCTSTGKELVKCESLCLEKNMSMYSSQSSDSYTKCICYIRFEKIHGVTQWDR